MPRKKLRIADEVSRYYKHFHPDLKRKFKEGFKILLENPDSGKPLEDELTGFNTFRIGKYRIIYKVSTSEVEIAALGPRATIYEDALRLMKSRKKPN